MLGAWQNIAVSIQMRIATDFLRPTAVVNSFFSGQYRYWLELPPHQHCQPLAPAPANQTSFTHQRAATLNLLPFALLHA
jgi:hypothetical protein